MKAKVILFSTKSIMNPAIIPITNFIASIFKIVITGICADINIGNISSDVVKYIDINVPKVTILPIYKFVAITENPHCGNNPNTPPIAGPNFPDFFISPFILELVLCSKNSINKYVINKNGINFILSNSVCSTISNISDIFPLYDVFNKLNNHTLLSIFMFTKTLSMIAHISNYFKRIFVNRYEIAPHIGKV